MRYKLMTIFTADHLYSICLLYDVLVNIHGDHLTENELWLMTLTRFLEHSGIDICELYPEVIIELRRMAKEFYKDDYHGVKH